MKYLFLDLDNTVTESRSQITPEMFDVLSQEHVHIVSGASREQIKKQIRELDCSILAQNGNDNPLWTRNLTGQERESIYRHLEHFADFSDDHIEDRGSQISYSFVGHNAPLDIKKQFDPSGDKRNKIVSKYKTPEGIEAKVAGTTCLDYLPANCNKGANIRKYIEAKGWSAKDCLYIGDALFPGGNDESVIGVIPTFPVKSPKETLDFLL